MNGILSTEFMTINKRCHRLTLKLELNDFLFFFHFTTIVSFATTLYPAFNPATVVR